MTDHEGGNNKPEQLRAGADIPEDLKAYYADAKRRASGYKSPEVELIERIAKAEAEIRELRRTNTWISDKRAMAHYKQRAEAAEAALKSETQRAEESNAIALELRAKLATARDALEKVIRRVPLVSPYYEIVRATLTATEVPK